MDELVPYNRNEMKKGGGRSKGSSFERQVAKMVVTAFADFGVKKRDCYRTPLSGGHIHAKHLDPGDLVISKKLKKFFPFHVECKFYRRVELWPLWLPIDKHKPAWKFKKWLDQTLKACGPSKRHYPMLIWKENLGPVFCMVQEVVPLVLKIRCKHRTWYKGEKWFVMRFEDLLDVLVREAKVNGIE